MSASLKFVHPPLSFLISELLFFISLSVKIAILLRLPVPCHAVVGSDFPSRVSKEIYLLPYLTSPYFSSYPNFLYSLSSVPDLPAK